MTAGNTLRRSLVAACVLSVVWSSLARGEAGWFAAGAIAIGVTLWTLHRTAIAGGGRLRWSRLPAFAALFVRQSLRGGFDVVRRILSPDMQLQCGFVTLRLDLPTEGARVLLALVVSLMPGTLAARLEGDRLTVHALDLAAPVESDTRRIEREIARLFGVSTEQE